MSSSLKSALTASLLLTFASSAFADGGNPNLEFTFSGNSFSQLNQGAPNIGISTFIHGTSSLSGSFTSPDGTQHGTLIIADRGSGVGQGFTDFPTFKSINATPAGGTWTLTAVTDAGTSQYQFTTDFSSVAIPQSIITSPIQDSIFDSTPTFTWSTTGPGNTVIQLVTPDFSTNITQLLPPNTTSFTPAAPLAPGNYSFFVETSLPQTDIPIHFTHLSGPDLSLTGTGTFTFLSEAFSDFTIAPEPTALLLLLPSMLLLRRRKNA